MPMRTGMFTGLSPLTWPDAGASFSRWDARPSTPALEAHASGRGVAELVIEKGLMTREKLDEVLRPELLTRPQPLG